jgi:hypothetical protein
MNGLGAHEPTPTHAQRPPCFQVCLRRGGHRWTFSWDPGDESALIDAISDLAANEHVAFDWFDAAVICRQIASDRAAS